eukprot:scaffold6420_cov168-Amphora_coffeaeformis.AAC.16
MRVSYHVRAQGVFLIQGLVDSTKVRKEDFKRQDRYAQQRRNSPRSARIRTCPAAVVSSAAGRFLLL